MRRCRFMKKIEGQWVVIYSGTQKTHMQKLLNHAQAKGEMVKIEEDSPHKRRPRYNQITGARK